MALGVGANTALFSLLQATVLAPLPFAHPDQLVEVVGTQRSPGAFPLSGPDFRDVQHQATSFPGMSLYRYPLDFALTGHGAPLHVRGVEAEPNFFHVLGVKPALGRLYPVGGGNDAAAHVAVLSYGFWRSTLGGARNVIGEAITLDGKNFTVGGVLPNDFRWQPAFQVWVFMPMTNAALGPRGFYSFSAVGRLRTGVSVAAAQSQLDAIAARLARAYPATNHGIGARAVPLHNRVRAAPNGARCGRSLRPPA